MRLKGLLFIIFSLFAIHVAAQDNKVTVTGTIVDAATGGSVAITWTEKPRYFKGDVNGDGVLDGDDIRYMASMVQQKAKPSADEQKAWPLPQGSPVCTATSYQQLKKYFAEQGISNR